jgi:hypothetical protein
MAQTLPPAGVLWDEFAYNPITGELFWRNAKQGRSRNKPAGTNDNGYRKVRLSGAPYLVHRLVWCWVTGNDPGTHDIDHIDRSRSNNRWWNLRLATAELNAVNNPHKGYYLRKDVYRSKPWCVTVYKEKGKHSCHHFATEAEARECVEKIRNTRLSVLPDPELTVSDTPAA